MTEKSAKATLAQRLRELMDTRPDLDTQAKVAARTHLSQSTVARILSQQQAASVDSLEAIAHAFGLQPYELLMPEPQDATLARGLDRLSPADKQRILSYIEIVVGVPLWQTSPAQLTAEFANEVSPGLLAASQRAATTAPRGKSAMPRDASDHHANIKHQPQESKQQRRQS